MEGGHGNCCRFATLTGVHQGAHICLAKLWFIGKVRTYVEQNFRNILQEKMRGRGGFSCRFDCLQKKKMWAMQHRCVSAIAFRKKSIPSPLPKHASYIRTPRIAWQTSGFFPLKLIFHMWPIDRHTNQLQAPAPNRRPPPKKRKKGKTKQKNTCIGKVVQAGSDWTPKIVSPGIPHAVFSS